MKRCPLGEKTAKVPGTTDLLKEFSVLSDFFFSLVVVKGASNTYIYFC